MGISYKVINTRQADADEIEIRSNDYAKDGYKLKGHRDGVMVFERERLTPEEIQVLNKISESVCECAMDAKDAQMRSW